MRPRRFFWKLLLGNAALMVIVLITCTYLIIREFDRLRRDETALYLQSYATGLAVALDSMFDPAQASELQQKVQRAVASDSLGARITIVGPDGRVWADTQAEAAKMGAHGDRPEIIRALADGFGSANRWSQTVSREMHYAAVRVGDSAHPRGVLRVGIPANSIVSRGHGATRLAITIAVLGLGMMVLLALGIARLWSRRIGAITEASLRLLRGNLAAKIDVAGDDEVAMLARSLNSMRDRLAHHLSTIERQNTSLKSMLAQLREGVIIIGPDGRIRLINPEAIRLLDMSSPRRDGVFEGLSVEQCIPHHDVHVLLHSVPDFGESLQKGAMTSPTAADETDIRFNGRDGEKSLRARVFHVPLFDDIVKGLSDDANNPVGRLLVFTDVTQLTAIIQMKSDFAANASHELRTPLSAMKAAVETLRTLDGIADQPQAARFFDMIERQMSRMEAMVLDLLDLSRVETPSARFQPDSVDLPRMLAELREAFDLDLAEKQLRWELDIAPECERLFVSPQLLLITLRNLLENAIRFTAAGGFVRVTTRRQDSASIIEVADNGCGIPLEDQPRVFERFYQVERARSGQKRGTGLGLSIVRHSVSAMRGTVQLRSELGSGTTVSVELPNPKC